MTSVEMKNEFNILYDKITSFSAPGYDDEEISIILTKAQERVFLDEYNGITTPSREGFEKTEFRKKDLRELVKGAELSQSADQIGIMPNGVFFDLPSDCTFIINEEVVLSSTDSCLNNKRIRIKPITHDYYSINRNNPFKKPNDTFAWRLDFNTRRHEIITKTGTTVNKYIIRYLQKPEPIITAAATETGKVFTVEGFSGPKDCLLSSILHRRIIDEAVKIATGVTNQELYQIKSIEQQDAEQ